VLFICGFISILGLVLTFLFIEDRRGKGMKGDDEAKARLLNKGMDDLLE
jgi:hypothetical protein